MLTEKTTNAFPCIEMVDNNREDIFKAALNELKEKIQKYLGEEVSIQVVDVNHQDIDI